MLSLLGVNIQLLLFHMAKSFIWLEETKELINNFPIGYMIDPKLNINKSFREKVDKYMNTTFGPITQTFITTTLAKNKTRVLALLMLYETRNNLKKSFKLLSCFIYTIINNYVCIDYLACEKYFLSEIPVGYGGFLKHVNKSDDKILGMEFQILY